MVNTAAVAVTDIVKSWDNSHKLNLVARVIESLSNVSNYFSKLYRMLRGINVLEC